MCPFSFHPPLFSYLQSQFPHTPAPQSIPIHYIQPALSLLCSFRHSCLSQFFSHLFQAVHPLTAPQPPVHGNRVTLSSMLLWCRKITKSTEYCSFTSAAVAQTYAFQEIWPTLTQERMQHRWNQRFKLLK